MQVGVFDSAHYATNAKVKILTFPNYSDPAFPKKWKNMGDSAAFPVEELPSEGKENNLHLSFSQLVSGPNSTNPAISLLPGAGGMFLIRTATAGR